MTELLKGPKKLPVDELTRTERENEKKYPDYIIPLRARVRTPEQNDLYEHLEDETRRLNQELSY